MTVVGVEKRPEDLSLVLVVEFEAPLERVWRLWADPRQLERWWGPPSWPATFERHDLTAGGEATYFMTGPEGERSYGWWHVTAVDPPRSLEFLDRFAAADGTPLPQSPTTTGRVQLTERDGRTRMELRFVFESVEHMERVQELGAFDVFPQSVAQMDAVLSTQEAR